MTAATPSPDDRAAHPSAIAVTASHDPVCGMTVDPQSTPHHATYQESALFLFERLPDEVPGGPSALSVRRP
jgi:hypothetical protein